jgi:hypothetical protein
MSLATARAQAPVAKLDDLAWLEGRWEGEQDGLAMEEQWTSLKGGALLGLHRDVKGGRMVSFEFLRIQTTPDGIVYFASPRSRPPVPFALVESVGRRAVFENKQHDFPQRILYWMTDDDTLHAGIEGPPNAKEKAMEWAWKRSASR